MVLDGPESRGCRHPNERVVGEMACSDGRMAYDTLVGIFRQQHESVCKNDERELGRQLKRVDVLDSVGQRRSLEDIAADVCVRARTVEVAGSRDDFLVQLRR